MLQGDSLLSAMARGRKLDMVRQADEANKKAASSAPNRDNLVTSNWGCLEHASAQGHRSCFFT